MSVLAYIIFVVAAVLAFAVGSIGGYFYYGATNRESSDDLEALKQDLTEREEDLRRRQAELTSEYLNGDQRAQEATVAEIRQLREELEKKKNDYEILRQDFDVELGVLKQEIEQFKARKSDVDQSRRTSDRKYKELAQREEALRVREQDLTDREGRLSAREGQVEEEVATKHLELEEALADRERKLLERLSTLQQEQAALAIKRRALSEKESRLEEEFMALPEDKFTSRREAVLIKQLRQQNQMQRKELEHLQRRYHREQQHSDSGRGGRDTPAASRDAEDQMAEHRQIGAQRRGQEGDSLPDLMPSVSLENAFHEDADGEEFGETSNEETNAPEESFDGARQAGSDRIHSTNGEQHADDLTSLLGIDQRLQQQLNRSGITSFDQIARWSSADIRRISERLQVDSKTIQDNWIVNAQSHVFAVALGNRDHTE